MAQNVFILFKKVFDEVDITAKELPEEKYLEHLLATPTFHIFAAIADGKIVGGLTAYEFEMYLKKEKEAYLYDLAVDKDYRRQGIARALMDRIKRILSGKQYLNFVRGSARRRRGSRRILYGARRPNGKSDAF